MDYVQNHLFHSNTNFWCVDTCLPYRSHLSACYHPALIMLSFTSLRGQTSIAYNYNKLYYNKLRYVTSSLNCNKTEVWQSGKGQKKLWNGAICCK